MRKMGHVVLSAMVAMGLGGLAQAQDTPEHWTGGAGMESREKAPDYNTAIQFFAQDGSYLSEIWYTLYDNAGERLLQGMSTGPWLVVDLDPGRYSLAAQRLASGEEQAIRFHVSESEQMLGVKFTDN